MDPWMHSRIGGGGRHVCAGAGAGEAVAVPVAAAAGIAVCGYSGWGSG